MWKNCQQKPRKRNGSKVQALWIYIEAKKQLPKDPDMS